MPPVFVQLHPARSETSASLAVNAPTTVALEPAASVSSASLALTVPTAVALQPAVSESSASLSLTTRATPSGYEGMPLTIQPNTAAELHAHEWPPTLLEGVPMLAAAVYVVARENFRYVWRLPHGRRTTGRIARPRRQ